MKFLDAIFCDDIRQELNSKLSVMGLYNDRIVLTVNENRKISWPQPINLATLLRFVMDENDEKPDSFKFEYLLNKKSILKINGNINAGTGDQTRFQLIFNRVNLPIQPGELGFSIKLYAKNKVILSEKKEAALAILKN